MFVKSICPPALLYLGFSLAQIFVDTLKGLYNAAFFKFVVMIVFTILLNILCAQGLSIISWLIVFVPFIIMTFITSLLLFVFDLSPEGGSTNYKVDKPTAQAPLIDIPSMSQIETSAKSGWDNLKKDVNKVF
jgi:hypothetical protein